jgi:hypothetical protein
MDVAEGGDDPYSYYYCVKLGWTDGEEPEPGQPDHWVSCASFQSIESKHINNEETEKFVG